MHYVWFWFYVVMNSVYNNTIYIYDYIYINYALLLKWLNALYIDNDSFEFFANKLVYTNSIHVP